MVAVGLSSEGKNGEIQPVSIKVGDKVVLPKYGGTKVILSDRDYVLIIFIREHGLGMLPRLVSDSSSSDLTPPQSPQ